MGNAFYHYTSRDSKKEIIRSKKIKQSTHDDLLDGPGVYLTTLPPAEGKREIARNNYDTGGKSLWENMEKQGRIDCVFRITLNMSDVDKVPAGPRDIYVYRGDLDLNKVSWDVMDLDF